jgi:hypothetical protein
MYLHKFTIEYKTNSKEYNLLGNEFIYKFCRYPKKTKLYKQLMNLLDQHNSVEFIRIEKN